MSPREPIAIVGMGCRFPGGADNPDKLWRLLVDGVDAISEIPSDRWHLPSFYHPDATRHGRSYSRWGGFLQRVEEFDAHYFGISPREASKADPQQRLLLQVACEALDDAGIAPDHIAGTRGAVFIGISTYDYGGMQTSLHERASIDAYTNLGSALCISANRISYFFDLHGPSMAVDTACSSSLVAAHLACQSIWNNECDLAFIGGANLMLRPEGMIGFSKASMLAPDGRCKSFAAAANGYVRAEGVGVVIVKPLRRALESGDRIHAVVRSTAVNQDGRTGGISVPSGAAQEAMLREALREADIPAESVQYVEAHGTGTPVGDPIEATALGRVYGEHRAPGDCCLIGSIKSNIGHCEAASGIAGLIKSVLCLEHAKIPANLHLATPNPAIPFGELHLRPVSALQDWPDTNGHEFRVGVNSFGFGGTNAHMILERAPATPVPPAAPQAAPPGRAYLLPLSARSEASLKDVARSYIEFLTDDIRSRDCTLHDISYAASLKRGHHDYRLALVAHSRDELLEHLHAFLAGEHRATTSAGRATSRRSFKPVFVCTGMGQQHWDMGRELLADEPVYRETMESVDALFRALSGWSVLEILRTEEARGSINQAHVAQPAIFAMQIALAALWRSWGIEPVAVIGHSVGEVAAAFIAGALTLEDAVQVIFHRSRLQGQLAGKGAMLAVGISTNEVEEALGGKETAVCVAAVNSPRAVTLSGDENALKELAGNFESKGIFCRMLQVDVPYHSPAMDPLREEFVESLRDLRPRAVKTPLFSTVTGKELGEELLDAGYWWRNIRSAVQFQRAIEELLRGGHEIFLELGAHPILNAAILECSGETEAQGITLCSLHRKRRERAMMLGSLGILYTSGAAIDWGRIHTDDGCPVNLPLYPWQNDRHWSESEESLRDRLRPHFHPLLARRLDSAQPCWETELDPVTLPFLKDHRVKEATICPGALFVEMALAAADRALGHVPCILEDLEFIAALFLPEGGVANCQVSVNSPHSAFEIASRPAGSTSWVVHAKGRLRASDQPALKKSVALEEIRGRCRTVTTKDECYRAFGVLGLNYGPMFQGIEKLWSGAAEALGEIRLPASIEEQFEDFRLHPVILDAAFQSLLGTLQEWIHAQGFLHGTYLPVRIEKIVFHATPGKYLLSHAKLTEHGARRLKGDVRLLDEAGKCLVEISGLICRWVDHASASSRGCLYEYQWRLRPHPWIANLPRLSEHLASPCELAESLRQETLRLQKELRRDRYYADFTPAIRDVAAAYAVSALRELGWNPERDAAIPLDEQAARLHVVPEHCRLLDRLLHELSPDDIAADRDPRSGWANLWRQFPDAQAELTLLRECGPALPAVLRGAVDPLTLVFPEGSATTLEYMYRDAPSTRIYNRLVQKALGEIVGRLPKGRILRILEIGGGTGGLTSYVLPMLPPHLAQYVFTDVGPSLVSQAEQRFSEYSFVQYKTLDIENDPLNQGFGAHSFDVILASDALHATRDLREAMDHVRLLLGSSGLLILLEGTRVTLPSLLTFGLLRGWWRFADESLRKMDPWIRPLEWQRLLESVGFRDTLFETDCEEVDSAVHSVILARGPTLDASRVFGADPPTKPGSWLLLCDRDGTNGASAGLAIAGLIRRRGDHTILIWPGEDFLQVDAESYQLRPDSSEDMKRLIESIGPNLKDCRGVVHLWSLDAAVADRSCGAPFERGWVLNCVSALHLMQALGACDADVSPSLWLVTRNAHYIAGTGGDVDVAQAPLWGLARVAANEYPQLRCRIVDLRDHSSEECLALTDELYANDVEDEVAIRGEARYVHRMAQTTLSTLRPIAAAAVPAAFCVKPQTPGILDSLAANMIDRRAPRVGEVEIEIQATGLNFKDVMLSMALLPDEAMARTPGGVPLGLECAGRIVAVGKRVKKFSIGDEVVACAPGSLGSHVTVDTRFVKRKPADLGFEEASTIPVAFLTAYYALHHLGRMQRGDRVLIHAATGGVGLAAIQLAQRAGAEIFATAGTPAKRNLLRSLGLEHVMDSRTLAFADEVLLATRGEGVDLVLNSLAGEAITKSLAVLRSGGRFLEIGRRDIFENSLLGLRPFHKNLSFFAIDLEQVFTQSNVIRELFDQVMKLFADQSLRPISYRTISAGRVVGAFRHMAQAKHVGKVVLAMHETQGIPIAHGRKSIRFPQGGTYLITGGLGGFGLVVAKWFAENGARHLILMGRQNPSPEAQAAIDALEANGVQVVVQCADVTNLDQVRGVFDLARHSMPALRGVVHAAMVLDDASILNLTAERMRSAFAAKAVGAWNLHTLTADMQLDLFIMFSSITSMIGNPGQANYVAGNAVLDSLAQHRRLNGLAALTVNWGALGQTGYVARNPEVKKRLENIGLKALPAEEMLEVLGELIAADAVQVGVAKIDWARAVRFFGARVSPKFADVIGMMGNEDGGSTSIGALSAVLDADPAQRPALIAAFIRDHLAKVMGISPARLDGQEPLLNLGVDSLMAVEMRNRIQQGLNVDVPPTKFLEGIGIDGLAAFIAGKLEPTVDQAAPVASEPIIVAPLSPAQEEEPDAPAFAKFAECDEIDKLSDEEVDSRLRVITAEENVTRI